MSTATSPDQAAATTSSWSAPESDGARYVRLMREAVLHPDDAFHQDVVEQLDRLCLPWSSMDGAELRSVLEGIHDELLILLHQLGTDSEVRRRPT